MWVGSLSSCFLDWWEACALGILSHVPQNYWFERLLWTSSKADITCSIARRQEIFLRQKTSWNMDFPAWEVVHSIERQKGINSKMRGLWSLNPWYPGSWGKYLYFSWTGTDCKEGGETFWECSLNPNIQYNSNKYSSYAWRCWYWEL